MLLSLRDDITRIPAIEGDHVENRPQSRRQVTPPHDSRHRRSRSGTDIRLRPTGRNAYCSAIVQLKRHREPFDRSPSGFAIDILIFAGFTDPPGNNYD
ncbi:hypothetical protein [Burkholderia territorii]|uniref:hypothetical protein n=1 Tax=Burkholderia territorii TaxID=1503055 RepID=UPI000B169E76|nr:hypothetical protein [Burkholderia territorii]